MPKLENRVVVSEIPDTPKLGVSPLRRPPDNDAVSHNLVIVIAKLFPTRGPLLLVLIERPVLPDKLKVGVMSIFNAWLVK